MPFDEEKLMQVVSIISTKGGVGKTTTAANLGGFIADAGLRVLLLDRRSPRCRATSRWTCARPPASTRCWPSTAHRAGLSRTAIAGLDWCSPTTTAAAEHAAAARSGWAPATAPFASRFRPHYDLLLIDTQGARSVLLEMAVLASDGAVAGDAGNPRGTRAATRHAATDRGHRAVSAPGHRTAAAAPAHQPCASGVVERTAGPAGAATGVREQAGVQVTPTCRPSKPIRALRHEDCRCIGWSTGGRLGARRPQLDTMRTLAGELFPRGGSASRWSPAGPMREGQPWRARMNWRAAVNGCAR